MNLFSSTIKKNVLLVFKGIVMGAANKVPGVSGGVVAFVAGFYEELIYSLQKINLKAFSILVNHGWKSFVQYINGGFLGLLFLGVGISYFSVSLLLDFLIKNFETEVFGLFFGMILSSLYFIYQDIKKWNYKIIGFFLMGLSCGLLIMFTKPMTENDYLPFVFFCGFIGVSGMTLPGLSGSFLLLLLGNYSLLLVDAVNALYFTIADLLQFNLEFVNDPERVRLLILVLVFTLGSVTGLIVFSNVLSWVLKKYKESSTATIIGFIAGSLGMIWPWKDKIYKIDSFNEILYNAVGNPIIAHYDYFLPNFREISFWIVLIFIILGAITVALLERYGVSKK